jgi:hypothetical protein
LRLAASSKDMSALAEVVDQSRHTSRRRPKGASCCADGQLL